jgi:hypothetical protein
MTDMTNGNNQVERLERLFDRLADSVLELSDDAILAEAREEGLDPEAEAERMRQLLQQSAKSFCTKRHHTSDRSAIELQRASSR